MKTNTIISVALSISLLLLPAVTEAKSKFLVIGCKDYHGSPNKCDGGGVFAGFDDVEKAKLVMEANAHVYKSRMIAEYTDCKLLPDPRTIAGVPQTAANGFSKWWVNWQDVGRMMRPAKAWIKENPMDCTIMQPPPPKVDKQSWSSLKPTTYLQHHQSL